MFGFQTVNREKDFHYKNNFLRSVTFQIGYKPLDLKREDFDWLNKYLSSNYPNIQAIVKGNVTISQGVVQTASQKNALNGISAATKDNNVSLNVTNDHILYTINGASYINFKDFFDKKYNEIEQIIKYIKVSNFNKVAIRKINMVNFSITEDGLNLTDIAGMIFNSKLVENMKVIPKSNNVVKGLNNTLINNEKNLLNLVYGFIKDETQESSANAILDIDISIQKGVDYKDLNVTFENINSEIFNIFCWAIQEETRNKLND